MRTHLGGGLTDFLKQVGPEGRVSHRSKKGPKSGRKTGSLLCFRANIPEENHLKETCLLSMGLPGSKMNTRFTKGPPDRQFLPLFPGAGQKSRQQRRMRTPGTDF